MDKIRRLETLKRKSLKRNWKTASAFLCSQLWNFVESSKYSCYSVKKFASARGSAKLFWNTTLIWHYIVYWKLEENIDTFFNIGNVYSYMGPSYELLFKAKRQCCPLSDAIHIDGECSVGLRSGKLIGLNVSKWTLLQIQSVGQ